MPPPYPHPPPNTFVIVQISLYGTDRGSGFGQDVLGLCLARVRVIRLRQGSVLGRGGVI